MNIHILQLNDKMYFVSLLNIKIFICISELVNIVELGLSDPNLSIPLIIQNDVWKFLKQVMPNC